MARRQKGTKNPCAFAAFSRERAAKWQEAECGEDELSVVLMGKYHGIVCEKLLKVILHAFIHLIMNAQHKCSNKYFMELQFPCDWGFLPRALSRLLLNFCERFWEVK